jgi:uncharacterized protein YecE (DUF72 family)
MISETSAQFYIGTCGYAYPGEPPNGWNGVFYPKRGKRRADPLEFYANYFNAVEINSTFYRPASAAMAHGWISKTPVDFVFTVKVWQKFTHAAKLGNGASGTAELWAPFDRADIEYFSAGIAPLVEAGRLGGLLFQYPAGFVRNSENAERLEAALAAFNFCFKVVELRHRSWSDRRAETNALLARLRASWAFIDEPKFATSVRQDLTASSGISYLRLHGRNAAKWWKHQEAWERYDYFYPAENIHRLAERLRQLAGRSPRSKFYVFFNNHARAQAVANGLMLLAALTPGAQPRAPQSMIEAFPDLANLDIVSDPAGGTNSG